MREHQTETGHAFYYETHTIPQKDRSPLFWHDVWATIRPKNTEDETLTFCWSLVLQMAAWLKNKKIDQDFRIIVGWDKSVREHQGQIFKIFEPVEELDFVLSCATAEQYRESRAQSLAPLPGWQKDVFRNVKTA
jgi:hypothetical protein